MSTTVTLGEAVRQGLLLIPGFSSAYAEHYIKLLNPPHAQRVHTCSCKGTNANGTPCHADCPCATTEHRVMAPYASVTPKVRFAQ
jgi:hypothetical protein